MTLPLTYAFRRATMADLPCLTRWQATPHVLEWWEDAEPFDAEELADPRVTRWIVSHHGRPFAYMQDYTVHGWEGHYFAHLPTGSRGIDQYIGPAEMLGRGHGTGFIKQRVKVLFEEGAPVVAVDPHPNNARAIAAYEKAGFKVAGEAISSKWGLILPMEIHAPPAP